MSNCADSASSAALRCALSHSLSSLGPPAFAIAPRPSMDGFTIPPMICLVLATCVYCGSCAIARPARRRMDANRISTLYQFVSDDTVVQTAEEMVAKVLGKRAKRRHGFYRGRELVHLDPPQSELF